MTTSFPQLVGPFMALRYADTSQLAEVLSPPYDVISAAMRDGLAARHEQNIVHVIQPEADTNRYERAAATLERWRATGALIADVEPSVSVLQQEFSTPDGNRYTRTGLIAAVWAEPYSTGRIRPHERTHAGPKEDRLRLMRATKAAVEPLFFFSKDPLGQLEAFFSTVVEGAPDVETRLDEVAIRVWHVVGTTAAATLLGLSEEPLYIADGHHRFETAVAYREEDPSATCVVACIVPAADPGLVVLPTHRLVSGASKPTPEALTRTGLRLHAKGVPDAACQVIFADGREFSCTVPAPDESETALQRLAIARIERAVVEPLVRAAGTGALLHYTADERDARARVAAEGVTAVLVPPTPVDDVLAVADEGGYMPPKSTYFFPKLPSGLVIMPFA